MLDSDPPQANVTATTERHTLQARVDRAYFFGGPVSRPAITTPGPRECRVRVPATAWRRNDVSLHYELQVSNGR